MSKSLSAIIETAKLPERSVSICLRADLVAEHEAAERDLEQATARAGSSLAGGGVAAIAARIADLEEQMRDTTYVFLLRALPRHGFRSLMTEHPPRDGERLDAAFGVNAESFFPALIRRSTVDAGLDDEQWRVLLDEKLTDYQFQDLAMAAWAVNAREVDIPFSRAASRVRQATDAG